ncbi:MAG: hypothetical protein HRT88_18315, partial [Lentisphaeraceae bacterium]|nr:hypothetical protein [Lentisphaeraceae bacterium]
EFNTCGRRDLYKRLSDNHGWIEDAAQDVAALERSLDIISDVYSDQNNSDRLSLHFA